jgi:plastocyanin
MSIAALADLQSQIVINEVMYNPPETGTDSLEYIELLNITDFDVNLGGMHFTYGIEDTLPNIILGPGEYYVVTVNASAMMNVFGIVADEWTSGGLNNSGEPIVLVDAALNIIDSMSFEDSDPWPSLADGSGPSLELIDPGASHTDPANWQTSGTGTGVIIEGFEVFGTPGAENSGGGTGGPAITILLEHTEFTPRHAVVALGDVVRWTNPEAVPHNVNGSQAAYAGNPDDIYSGPPAPGPWEFDFTTAVAGFYNYHCDVHLGQGMTGTLSVYDPDNYTDFPLDQLRLTDHNGSHIYDGVPTCVEGVVYGINFQPSGYSFYIINDDNVGINVFSFDPGSYEVQDGDRLRVCGVIDQFNGLLEIIPDEIAVLATNQTRPENIEVSTITEIHESSAILVTISSVDSIQATGTSGFNVYAKTMAGTDVLIRIDADSGINPDWVSGNLVFGVGTQFDPDFPFTDGYQILAIEIISPPGVPVLHGDAISLSPNPVKNKIRLESDFKIEQVEFFLVDGTPYGRLIGNLEGASIDVSGLPTGILIIKATTPEGIWTSRILVTE